MASSFRDRTNEFHSMCERIRTRTHTPTSILERRALLSPEPSNASITKKNSKKAPHARSEFSVMAAEISRQITNTASKLEKLTKLAKRKTLFDDRPVEISELTFIIKQDIAKLNKQIAMLQDYTKHQKQASKQATEHTSNVVVALQSKLADTSMSFKDVLEIRTENMKMSKDKRDQFLFSAAEQGADPALANSPLMKSRRRGLETTPISSQQAQPTNSVALLEETKEPEQQESTLSLGIPMITQQQQQEMMVMEQDRYIDHRSSAIESIESTIAELGSIFQQLATMVAEQRETVQRIDQNTDDIEMNVMGAQRELLKYYTSISSNRWLIIKIFVTIVLFFLLFTFIM
ncbi:putative NADH-ubiquinone oxidoreductase 30.4 kDa subunit, mitochondrial [Mucor velutinosus]|uniref:NADH-ubiquinone oxidoreductase 30.4 kDa subunit, mitochondrial n=1 Tax=Mucor velutinosus TaxID=708070 RepID=A0AAN7HWH8_9FUNG|nr:putative NADH-ubiquinone oxidoreductase 30.4 kDa subunit, mitochondrial [Mucor velutinosus]